MRARRTAALSAFLTAVCVAGGEVRPAGQEASLEEVFASVHTAVVTLHTEGETGLRDAQGVAQVETGQGSGVLLELLSRLQDLDPTSRVSAIVLRGGKTLRLEAAAGDLAPWLAKPRARR